MTTVAIVGSEPEAFLPECSCSYCSAIYAHRTAIEGRRPHALHAAFTCSFYLLLKTANSVVSVPPERMMLRRNALLPHGACARRYRHMHSRAADLRETQASPPRMRWLDRRGQESDQGRGTSAHRARAK